MYHIKLLNILNTLEKSTWVKCHRYVRYRYEDPTAERLLFEEIYPHRSDLSQFELYRDQILQGLFPGRNRTSINNVISRLTKVIEQFIIIEDLGQEGYRHERQLILSKYYKRQGLTKYFLTETKDLIDRLEDTSDYNLSKRLQLFQTRFEVAYSEVNRRQRAPYFNHAIADLTEYTDHLSQLFHIEVKNQDRLYDHNLDGGTKHMPLKERPLHDYISQLSKVVLEDSKASFEWVRNHLFEYFNHMSVKLPELSLAYLLNFCLNEMKQGSAEYARHLLDLYERGLDTGILLHNGGLTERRFLTIVEVKSNLHPDKNHSEFIDKWIVRTETEYLESTLNMAKAHGHFGRGEYSKALKILHLLETRQANINLATRSRWMSICCIYALDNDRSHEYYTKVLATYRRYFGRSKKRMGERNYEGTMNLLKVLKMLWDKKDMGFIKAEVDSFDYLIFRFWIQKQINQN